MQVLLLGLSCAPSFSALGLLISCECWPGSGQACRLLREGAEWLRAVPVSLRSSLTDLAGCNLGPEPGFVGGHAPEAKHTETCNALPSFP